MTDWVRFRLRPVRSLLDLDIPLIRRRLARLGADIRFEIIDNRASDAMFVTALVSWTNWTESLWRRVKRAFLRLPKVTAFVADEHGEETPIELVGLEDLPRFTVRWDGS